MTIFKIGQKLPNICGTFVRKFVAESFPKYPNLETGESRFGNKIFSVKNILGEKYWHMASEKILKEV